MEFAAKTHIGKVRKLNEDSVFIDKTNKIMLVADGMGGHNAGEVASGFVVDEVKSKMNSITEGTDEPIGRIVRLIKDINSKIYKYSIENVDCSGMGTTCTLGFIKDEKLYIGHVGDSRLYIFREGSLNQITTDQTLVESMVAKGDISREEARVHPKRNMLMSAVGTEDTVEVARYTETLISKDIVLICSDGLNGYVEDEAIINVLQDNLTADQMCDKLIELSNAKGGNDNVTTIVVKF